MSDLFPSLKRNRETATVTHCALGWSGYPQVGYSDGTIMPTKKADLLLNREYYKHDPENLNAWPVDLETGEKLPVKS